MTTGLVLIGIAVLAFWLTRPPAPQPLPGLLSATPIAAVPPATSAEVRGLPTLAPMLRKAMPAVVSITVQARVPAEDNPLYRDPFYRRYFGDQPPAERRALAAGSGVIIDADRGLILTNNHVIQNAEQIAVALSDGRRIQARLIGTDPPTDIALISVAAKGLVALPLGNSGALEIGDYVVAIGNPFGLDQTATAGIVSALGRSGLGIEGYEDFIQTDAAVNPGNSGGALVNIEGELVGINAAIVGPAGGNVGIGFAIPTAIAREVADQLARFGAVKRGQLGVSVSDHPAEMPAGQQMEVIPGATTASVVRGSGAEKAGLRPGDIIVGVNGRPIVSGSQLRALVGLVRPGGNVTLDVIRNGERTQMTAQVTAADQ
ncbi:MAG: trypsin-like peptidase domain-containing protein [Rhodopila sp.]